MKVTLKHIAEDTGLSIATVSRALSREKRTHSSNEEQIFSYLFLKMSTLSCIWVLFLSVATHFVTPPRHFAHIFLKMSSESPIWLFSKVIIFPLRPIP